MKKLCSILLSLCLLSLYVPFVTFAYDGITDLTITTADQLKQFAVDVNGGNNFSGKTITLGKDIDLSTVCSESGDSWTPIGSMTNSFKGTFDGKSHTISKLYINNTVTSDACIGLFGYTKEATIKNLKLTEANINVTSDSNYKVSVGGIIGQAEISTIDNCEFNGNITGTVTNKESNAFGGICGYLGGNDGGKSATLCRNNASIKTGSNNVGGICGKADILPDFIIEKCFNTGKIVGGEFVGGLIGSAAVVIKNCYNTGEINGVTLVGGLVGGTITGSSTTIVKNSYNAGNIIASGKIVNGVTQAYAGGIIGYGVINKDTDDSSTVLSLGSSISQSTNKDMSDLARISGSFTIKDKTNLNNDIISSNKAGSYARKDMVLNGLTRTSSDNTSKDGKDLDVTSLDWKTTAFSTFDTSVWDIHSDDRTLLPTLQGIKDHSPTLPISISESGFTKEVTLTNGKKVGIRDAYGYIDISYKLKAEDITNDEETIDKIDSFIADNIKNKAIYRIYFNDESDSKIDSLKLDSDVEVYLPCLENYDENNLRVCCIDEDDDVDNLYKVEIKEVDGVKYACFKTNHFSDYALLDLSATSVGKNDVNDNIVEENNNIENNSSTNSKLNQAKQTFPKTGENTYLFVLIIPMIAMYLYIIIKNKKIA